MAEVLLSVEANAASSEQLDYATGLLFRQLRALNVLSVRRGRGRADEGAKAGVGSSIAELVLSGTLTSAAVSAAAKVIVSYVQRAQARKVTWTEGDRTVVFDGLSAKDQHSLVERVLANRTDAAVDHESAEE